VEKLLQRRTLVRELITSFRESSRQPFPYWDHPPSREGSRLFDLPPRTDTVPGRLM
jgi:hypothetical protein